MYKTGVPRCQTNIKYENFIFAIFSSEWLTSIHVVFLGQNQPRISIKKHEFSVLSDLEFSKQIQVGENSIIIISEEKKTFKVADILNIKPKIYELQEIPFDEEYLARFSVANF